MANELQGMTLILHFLFSNIQLYVCFSSKVFIAFEQKTKTFERKTIFFPSNYNTKKINFKFENKKQTYPKFKKATTYLNTQHV